MAEVEIAKIVGNLWCNEAIEIVDIDGRLFTLYGWRGGKWLQCWEIKDKSGLEAVDQTEHVIIPVYSKTKGDEEKITDYQL